MAGMSCQIGSDSKMTLVFEMLPTHPHRPLPITPLTRPSAHCRAHQSQSLAAMGDPVDVAWKEVEDPTRLPGPHVLWPASDDGSRIITADWSGCIVALDTAGFGIHAEGVKACYRVCLPCIATDLPLLR